MQLVVAMIQLKYSSLGVEQQSLTKSNVCLFFSIFRSIHNAIFRRDRAMLNCSDEYNETIQLSSVLYNYSTCRHGDNYGIQNLCDDQATCSFDVTNSNDGSSCGADGKASLQVSYNCKRKLYLLKVRSIPPRHRLPKQVYLPYVGPLLFLLPDMSKFFSA